MARVAPPAGRAVADLAAGQPPPWPESLLARIRRRTRDRTLVVLDDDPTGTQTVRDVRVLMDPSTAELAAVLAAAQPVVFVLTNSRSLPRERAVALADRLGRRIRAASRRSGRRVSLLSRSDSTLRGHFPAEVDALASAAGLAGAPVLLMPYLGEAGRVTADDIHYVVRDGVAVPVAETEFARDAAFGYGESNLREWAAARLAGAGGPRAILALSLADIRTGGPERVAAVLRAAPSGAVVVANALDDRDAEVVAAGVAAAEDDRPIVARTAAGYLRARAGQPRQPPLAGRAIRLDAGRGPGLVVVGSHVPTTTTQLEALLADPPVPVRLVEVPVADVADPTGRRRLLRATVSAARAALRSGAVPIVATSRELARPSPEDPSGLRLGGQVSRLLASVVRRLEPEPAWIVAKGGITSSDVATRGLGARQATVVGPLLAGVPVWRVARPTDRDVLLVVFPGNVGDRGALRSAVAALAAAGAPRGRRPGPTGREG